MRSVWYGLGVIAAVAFVLAGCAPVEIYKPPKHPEEYRVPPADDARYSQPPAFPKNTLNPDRVPNTGATQPNQMGIRGGRMTGG
jgi:hypothetical protein